MNFKTLGIEYRRKRPVLAGLFWFAGLDLKILYKFDRAFMAFHPLIAVVKGFFALLYPAFRLHPPQRIG